MSNTLHYPERLLRRTAPIALLLLASANLYAQHSMSISLRASEEVPPVTSPATATGQITVPPDFTVRGSIKPTGLVRTASPIDEAATRKNGPPIVTVASNADGNIAVTPQTELTDAQHSSYMACMMYVNVPSAQHPDAEIRAHLQSTATTTRP